MSSVLATVWRKEVERFVALCVCLFVCVSVFLLCPIEPQLKSTGPVFGRKIVMEYHVSFAQIK